VVAVRVRCGVERRVRVSERAAVRVRGLEETRFFRRRGGRSGVVVSAAIFWDVFEEEVGLGGDVSCWEDGWLVR